MKKVKKFKLEILFVIFSQMLIVAFYFNLGLIKHENTSLINEKSDESLDSIINKDLDEVNQVSVPKLSSGDNTYPELIWNVTWGTSNNEKGYGIDIDSSENIYTVGQNWDTSYNGMVQRSYYPNGSLKWSAAAGSGGDRWWRDLALSADENSFYCAGTAWYGTSGNTYDPTYAKHSATNGVQDWYSCHWPSTSSSYNSYAFGIDLDASDYAYEVGFTTGYGSGNDAFIIKRDPSASHEPYMESWLWNDYWDNGTDDAAMDVVVNKSSGDVYLTGYSDISSDYDIFLRKYNSSGTSQWYKSWDYGNNDKAHGIAFDNNSYIYVTGTTNHSGTQDVVLIKLDEDGNQVWNATWGGAGEDYGLGLICNDTNSIYVSGYTSSYDAQNIDVLLLKFDSDGNLCWNTSWGGSDDDYGREVDVYGTNIYIVGETASYGAGNADYLVMKYTERKALDIIINTPFQDQLFGNDAPLFNISIDDPELDKTWYTIDGGATNFTITGLTGSINQTAWEGHQNGSVNIIFYANDTWGNFEAQNVTVTKNYFILSPLIIDDDGGGDMNWATAAGYNWCNGSGTWGDPYIIKNLWIDAENASSCLTIKDSTVYFRIEDCFFINGTDGEFDAGLKLDNADNGVLFNNTCYDNQNYGILLFQSENNTIENCSFYDNVVGGLCLRNHNNPNYAFNNTIWSNPRGINLFHGHQNNITSNYLQNPYGIYIYESEQNNISLNTFQSCSIVGLDLNGNTDQNDIWDNQFNSNDIGIHIDSCISNEIHDNEFTNGNYGIYLFTCGYNLIQNNNITSAVMSGIYSHQSNMVDIFYNNITGGIACYAIQLMAQTTDCNVTGNIITNVKRGIHFGGSSRKNTFANNRVTGIQMSGVYSDTTARWNIIKNNHFSGGRDGVYLHYGHYYRIYDNNFTNNQYGIQMWYSENGTIEGNNFTGSTSPSINIGNVECINNTFYNNNFSNNAGHASNSGTNSYWDNGSLGNYWDNYDGYDVDNDGIGETPFTGIGGSSGGQDNYPICYREDDVDPIVFINKPELNDVYGSENFTFNISITEYSLNTTWYYLDDGSPTGNTTFTYLVNTSILLSIWNQIDNGSVTLWFYANDTNGNVGSDSILIKKDIYNPNVTIYLPLNGTYWNAAPQINLSVLEYNIDKIWYNVTGNSTKIFITNNSLNPLNQFIWNQLSEGLFQVSFFANDSVGNMNDTFTISLFKDIKAPTITINLPGNNTYWSSKPSINISASDDNFDSVWYRFGGINYTLTNGIEEPLDDAVWNALSDEQQFTLFIYVNDSAGNINNTYTLNLYRDTRAPTITINLPGNNTYWSSKPSINISASDDNFDSVWYRFGGINYTLTSGIEEPLDDAVWNVLSDEQQFTLFIYANDSVGNINNTYTLNLYRDTRAPTITINLPGNNTYWSSKPDINISASDANLASVWYRFGGINYTLTNGIEEPLDDAVWNALSDEQQFTLFIYANDSVGNINNTYTLNLYRDTRAPTITINLPGNNTYWSSKPSINISALDDNFDSVWYRFGGINYTLTNGIEEPLDDAVWNALSYEQQFTLFIYANDSVGNWNNTFTISLYKDVKVPTITINLPENNTYWNIAPLINVSVLDTYFNSTWYGNGTINITIANNGQNPLDASIWDTLPQGWFTLYIYANDSAGHLNDTYTLSLYKDTIDPIITINAPNSGDLFGLNAPNFNIEVDEINLNTTWYEIVEVSTNDTFTTNTSINSGIWATVINGTVTIRFYANDTAGNIGFNEVIIHKDVEPPQITINLPHPNAQYGINAPNFDITLLEANQNTTWYTIDNGLTNFTFSGNGQINQTAWENSPNGTVIIKFYANDTMGNVGTQQVSVIKYHILSPFVIDGDATGVGAHNWTWALSNDWCSGSGSAGDPYIIENIIINGDNSSTCLTIRDSSIFFKVINCTFYNSSNGGFINSGIKFINVYNGTLLMNNCSNNNGIGIYLINSENNNITENEVNHNKYLGIFLVDSNYTIIKGNTVNYNEENGIGLYNTKNNTITENTLNYNDNGIYIDISYNITISNNIATINNNVWAGIALQKSHMNKIINNIIRNNVVGIFLNLSNYNSIISNTLTGNGEGIDEINCIGNYFASNLDDSIPGPEEPSTATTTTPTPPLIPPQDSPIFIIIIGVVIGVGVIAIIAKAKSSGGGRMTDTEKLLKRKMKESLGNVSHDIKIGHYDKAKSNLNMVITNPEFLNFGKQITKAKTMLFQCSELEKMSQELEAKLLALDIMILDERFSHVRHVLQTIIYDAKSCKLKDIERKAQEKLNSCNKIEKIKNLESRLPIIRDNIQKEQLFNSRNELNQIIKDAQSLGLAALLNESYILLKEIDELEGKRKEIEGKFTSVESLIEQERFELAIYELNIIIEQAEQSNLRSIKTRAEESLNQFKEAILKKDELEKRFIDIEEKIKNHQLEAAERILISTKEIANQYRLTSIFNKTVELLSLCQEKGTTMEELNERLSVVDDKIKEKDYSNAIIELKTIIETAKLHDFTRIISHSEEKLDKCIRLEAHEKKGQIFIKILEFERQHQREIERSEMVVDIDVHPGDVDEYLNDLSRNVEFDQSELKELELNVSNVLTQNRKPSLCGIVVDMGYDLIFAKKMGKYLLKNGFISEFPRFPGHLKKIDIGIKKPITFDIEKCILCKGVIEGMIYQCPSCHSEYHLRCARSLKEDQDGCFNCKAPFPELPVYSKREDKPIVLEIQKISKELDVILDVDEILHKNPKDKVMQLQSNLQDELKHKLPSRYYEAYKGQIDSKFSDVVKIIETKNVDDLQELRGSLISMLKSIVDDVRDLKQGQEDLKQGQQDILRETTKILTNNIEQYDNLEIKTKTIRENIQSLGKKLDELERSGQTSQANEVRTHLEEFQKQFQLENRNLELRLDNISENIVTIMENHENLEGFLFKHLASDWEKIKDLWDKYKEGKITRNEMIKQGMKIAGKKFLQVFVKVII